MNAPLGRAYEPPSVSFADVRIDHVDLLEVRRRVVEAIETTGYVCQVPVNSIMKATRQPAFRNAINASLLSVPDGAPVAWFGRLAGCPRIRRVSGVEIFTHLLEAEGSFRHFLLGDTQETIDAIISKAQKRTTTLQIDGLSPPFRTTFTLQDNRMICDRINAFEPDFIWVSLGGGKQDIWMAENLHRIDRGVMFGIGAAFRYYSGHIHHPAKWIRALGLEWLSFALQEPHRAKGYIQNLPPFAIRFPFELIHDRLSRGKKNK